MLTAIHPKLPMRDKSVTRDFYINQLGFKDIGKEDYDGYLMVKKDDIEIHFFEFKDLEPKENYGQVYIRTDNIEEFYEYVQRMNIKHTKLSSFPWMQREFSIYDPDTNLLTIGQSV
ncbi:MAG: VOC family protein [Saprospiraceae bacterium]